MCRAMIREMQVRVWQKKRGLVMCSSMQSECIMNFNNVIMTMQTLVRLMKYQMRRPYLFLSPLDEQKQL